MNVNATKLATKINKTLPDSVVRQIAKASTSVKSNSPHILFAAGVVGFGATVILASRSTLKVGSIIEEHVTTANLIEEVHASEDEAIQADYSENDYRFDKIKLMANTFGNLTKLYLPAIVCGGLTIAAFTGAHIVMNNRITGLAAAYSALDAAYNKYRQRVVEEYGVEKDEEFRYNVVDQEVKNAEGKKTKEKVVDGNVAPSMYARFFDETNPNWQSDAAINRVFLSHVQNWMNDRLILKGHVMLNEVYDALGIERTAAGAVVGWVLNRHGGSGDDYVDFGIFEDGEWDYSKRLFVNGDEKCVLLDFNVNGVVYDLIDGTSD